MSTAAANPTTDDHDPVKTAKLTLPWLLSMVSHLGFVLLLALLIDIKPVEKGVGLGSEITVTLVGDGGGGGGDEGHDDETVEPEGGSPSGFVASPDAELDAPPPEETPAETATVDPLNITAPIPSLIIDDAATDLSPVELPSAVAAKNAKSTAEQATETSTPTPGMMRLQTSIQQATQNGNGRGANTGDGKGDGDTMKLARGNGGGPPGFNQSYERGKARTGVFGASGAGYKFIYVFDRSGSMDGHGGAPLAAAKSELARSINELSQTHQFQIIFYNEEPRAFSINSRDHTLVFATDQNQRLAERFIGGITADGATQHEDALVMALRLNPDVVFFLTDADEPTLSARQLARIARLNNGTTINTIEFGYGPTSGDENFLKRLARQNGGQHVYVDIGDLPRP